MNFVIDEKEIESLPITVDPEIVSGTPVFTGTRVPIDALITNLEAGLTLDEFLDNFPSVTHEQAMRITTLPVARATETPFRVALPIPSVTRDR